MTSSWLMVLLTVALTAASKAHALSQHPLLRQRLLESADTSRTTRRKALALPFLVAATMYAPPPATALDIDAFVSQELSSSTVPFDKKLSDDQALCRFGQPSKERGDACVRAGMSTTLRKGGVDAYGIVQRGDYVKCKIVYVNDPEHAPVKGFLTKTTVCQ